MESEESGRCRDQEVAHTSMEPLKGLEMVIIEPEGEDTAKRTSMAHR